MQQRLRLPSGLMLMSVLAACAQPAPTATGDGSWFAGIFAGSGRAPADLQAEPPKNFNAPVTPAPAATPTPAPTPSYQPTPTPAPLAFPSSATQRGLVAISCYLYDESNAPVDGGYVRVRSLSAEVPFDTSVGFSTNGQYNLGRLPAGVPIEIEAGLSNPAGPVYYTRRTRRVTLPEGSAGMTFRFGAPAGGAASDQAQFISNRPEVESVAFSTSNGLGEIRLTLNEPLAAGARTALAAALRVMPASAYADPDAAASAALSDLERQPDQIASYSYALSEGGDTVVRWNSVGDVASLIFPLSSLRSVHDGAIYQVALVSNGTVITDGSGLALGMGGPAWNNLSFGDYAVNGRLIYNAFKRPALALAAGDNTDIKRWGGTHTNSMLFKVSQGHLLPVDPVPYP